MSVRGQRIVLGVLLLIALVTGLWALLCVPANRWVGAPASFRKAEVRR